MAVVQSTYEQNQDIARIGQIANTQTADIDSYLAQEALGIPYGRAVRQGSEDHEVLIGIAPNGFVGIAVKDITRGPEEGGGFDMGAHLGAIWRGDIWVEASGAVSVGGQVYVEAKDGTLAAAVGSSLLNGVINASVTAVTVDTGAQFAVGDVVSVDNESMLVTARATNVLTVTRGYYGTTAVGHADNAPIAAGIAIPGGRWMGTAADEELAIVRLSGSLPTS